MIFVEANYSNSCISCVCSIAGNKPLVVVVVPGNFKNLYKNQENGLKCDLCPDKMTQNHCLICPERLELRKDLDMKNLDDLVSYFAQILSDR